ncbi:MAG TPA: hypothetical protein VHV30_16580 [Polyangiaceae bacterium]|jgi:hypothetical protein|nr:hypothetical protein [Polyangiaceae bacterium]
MKALVPAAIALAWGLVVAVSGYAIVRAIQHVVYPEPNPATLVWSAHSGFFWRVWTVAYAGGIASFAVRAVADPARAAKHLPTAVVIAAGLLAVQALFVP